MEHTAWLDQEGGVPAAPFGLAAQTPFSPREASVAIYPNHVPAFVDREMERIYQSIYSSAFFLRDEERAGGPVGTYVVRSQGQVTGILLFRIRERRIEVINEIIPLEAAEIERFAHHMFIRFGKADVIQFNAIRTAFSQLAFPSQRYPVSEDLVLAMPGSAQDYLASLGKSTRKTIKGYTNKLMRAFPSFRYEVCPGEQADLGQVQEIISFNRARMAQKNKVSAVDQAEADRIMALTRQYGLVGVATIDGRVCAGAVTCRVGDHYFMLLSAHDPRYDSFRLGMLCCYLTVADCVERGGLECHFLWGRYPHKIMLGGVPRNLDKVLVYRSRAILLRNADGALKAAFQGRLLRTRMWLLYDAAQQDGLAARLAVRGVDWLRRRRHRAAPVPAAEDPLAPSGQTEVNF